MHSHIASIFFNTRSPSISTFNLRYLDWSLRKYRKSLLLSNIECRFISAPPFLHCRDFPLSLGGGECGVVVAEYQNGTPTSTLGSSAFIVAFIDCFDRTFFLEVCTDYRSAISNTIPIRYLIFGRISTCSATLPVIRYTLMIYLTWFTLVCI